MQKKLKVSFKHSDGINTAIGFNAVTVLRRGTVDDYIKKARNSVYVGHPKQETLLKEVYTEAGKAMAEHEADIAEEKKKEQAAPAKKAPAKTPDATSKK